LSRPRKIELLTHAGTPQRKPSNISLTIGDEVAFSEVVAEGGGHEDVAVVAAVSGLNPDSSFINKHAISRVQAWVEAAMSQILLN
jgi:hypothetical protein